MAITMNKRLTILWLDVQRDPNKYFKIKKLQSAVWVRNQQLTMMLLISYVSVIWVQICGLLIGR